MASRLKNSKDQNSAAPEIILLDDDKTLQKPNNNNTGKMGRLTAVLVGAFAATGFIMEVEHGMLTDFATDITTDVNEYAQSAARGATDFADYAQKSATEFAQYTATDLSNFASNAHTAATDFADYASTAATDFTTSAQLAAQKAAADFKEFKESGRPLITISINRGNPNPYQHPSTSYKSAADTEEAPVENEEDKVPETGTTPIAVVTVPPAEEEEVEEEVEEKKEAEIPVKNMRGRNARGRGKPAENSVAAVQPPPAAAAAATKTTPPPPPPPAAPAAAAVRRPRRRGGGPTITKCDPSDRRALAANPSATDQDWEGMTRCLVRRDNHEKLGHFFMHISKSGGTSALDLFEEAGCNDGTIKKKFSAYHKPGFNLGFKCNWLKSDRVENEGYKIEFFALMDRNRMRPTTCTHTASMADRFGVPFLSSESTVPMIAGDDENNLCTEQYVNSIIVREPIKRIESHWKHMVTICTPREQCEAKFYKNPNATDLKFNHTYMSATFNLLTDNYVARSLVGRGYYEWEEKDPKTGNDLSIRSHPDAMTKIYPIANATLHKFDWVMVLDSGDPEEQSNLDLVVQYGLGLGKDKTFGHSRSGSKTRFSMITNPKTLFKMNSLDYKLWETAKELNRLDILSLEKMKPHYDNAKALSRRAKGKGFNEAAQPCCGIVCRNGETKWTPSQ